MLTDDPVRTSQRPFDVHRCVQDAHDLDAVRGRAVVDDVPAFVELPVTGADLIAGVTERPCFRQGRKPLVEQRERLVSLLSSPGLLRVPSDGFQVLAI